MKFRAIHWKALEAEVFQHRLANPDLNLDVTGNWQAFLWNDVCEQNPYLDCEDTEVPTRYPNLTDVWNWMQSMAGWAATGLSIVTQEAAEERAEICTKCPKNRFLNACFGCRGVSELLEKIVGPRTTTKDANLHQCGACGGCVLKVKVWLPLEAIKSESYQQDLPVFCWLKQPEAPRP